MFFFYVMFTGKLCEIHCHFIFITLTNLLHLITDFINKSTFCSCNENILKYKIKLVINLVLKNIHKTMKIISFASPNEMKYCESEIFIKN